MHIVCCPLTSSIQIITEDRKPLDRFGALISPAGIFSLSIKHLAWHFRHLSLLWSLGWAWPGWFGNLTFLDLCLPS